jgi:ferredoxin-type protein NapG
MHCKRAHGEDCTICVDKCPSGTKALQLTDHGILVLEEGCTGCGVCQNNCPTSPKAITVSPAHPVTCNPTY